MHSIWQVSGYRLSPFCSAVVQSPISLSQRLAWSHDIYLLLVIHLAQHMASTVSLLSHTWAVPQSHSVPFSTSVTRTGGTGGTGETRGNFQYPGVLHISIQPRF